MEIPQRISRQHKFTDSERLSILAEYEKCVEPGQKFALCRRIGLHNNTVARWARDKRDGLLVASDKKQNNHMMKHRDRLDYERVKRENERLKAKLEQSESAVEVLGKASELLAALAKSSQTKTPDVPEQSSIPPTFRGPSDDK